MCSDRENSFLSLLTLRWADGKWASTTQIRTSCMPDRLERRRFDEGMLIENQWNFHHIIVLLSGS